MRLFKKCFCEPKVSEKAMSFHMVRSALIIVACLIALSFSAYAWFTVDVSSGANTLVAARFNLDSKVTEVTDGATDEEEPKLVLSQGGAYNLPAGKYTVELSRTVNRSDAQKGFCIVKVEIDGKGTTEYHTKQVEDEGLTLTLTVWEKATVEFIPSLGTSVYYDTENPKYLESKTLEIGSIQETLQFGETLYTVVEGDSLYAIATKYGTTIEAISELNNIADRQTIYIGQQLTIPPAETEPPAETQ